MRANRLIATIHQMDFVIQQQGGAGKVGSDLLNRIESLKSKLAAAVSCDEQQSLSRQLGELEREHKFLLEQAGQQRLI